jgi:hypothetical protein
MSILDDINQETVELVPFTRETLAPLSSLGDAGVLTATSLNLAEEMDYDTYESLGTALGAFDRACRWWIGDWLIYGEGIFPDRYPQAARQTGLSEQTLLNRVTVSRAVPPARRRHLVSYSCHVVVAPLGAREQNRWLKYAETHGCTVAELKAAMKATRIDAQPVDTHDVGSEPNTDLLVDAARALVRNAELAGENVIVRMEDYTRVKAALGEEE